MNRSSEHSNVDLPLPRLCIVVLSFGSQQPLLETINIVKQKLSQFYPIFSTVGARSVTEGQAGCRQNINLSHPSSDNTIADVRGMLSDDKCSCATSSDYRCRDEDERNAEAKNFNDHEWRRPSQGLWTVTGIDLSEYLAATAQKPNFGVYHDNHSRIDVNEIPSYILKEFERKVGDIMQFFF